MDKKTIKNEEGSALVLVMMVLLVLSTLGAALGLATIGSLNLSENNQDINSAYYIAQAGANMAYEELNVEVDKAYHNNKQSESHGSFFTEIENSKIVKGEIINGKLTPRIYGKDHFDSNSNIEPSAEVKIIQLGEDTEKESTYKYMIQSTGNVDGKTRTVEKPVEITWKRSIGYGQVQWEENVAVVFREEMGIRDMRPVIRRYTTTVHGDIAYDNIFKNPKINSEKLGYSNPKPNIKPRNLEWASFGTFLETFPEEAPEYPIDKNYKEYDWWYDRFFSYIPSSITITNDTYIPTFDSRIYNKIVVDSEQKSVDLVVRDLNSSFISLLEIKGDTILNLYVTNSLDLRGISNLDTYREESQLNILYYGQDAITMNNTTNLHGSLFVKNAPLKIVGNSVITDGIISGGNEIEIYGDNDITGIVFAPNATVTVGTKYILSTIFLDTNINGIVLANKLILHGEVNITYDGRYRDDFYYYAYDAEVDADLDDLISAEPALEQ